MSPLSSVLKLLEVPVTWLGVGGGSLFLSSSEKQSRENS